MFRVQNNRQADITVRNDKGESHVLTSGINENVPEWINYVKYVEDLHDAGDILVIEATGRSFQEEIDALKDRAGKNDLPPAQYKLDCKGKPIQALGDDGEPLFDEATGESVYVPADQE